MTLFCLPFVALLRVMRYRLLGRRSAADSRMNEIQFTRPSSYVEYNSDEFNSN